MEVARDRRDDVHRPREPVVDPPAALVRELHEQGDEGDVLQVLWRGVTARLEMAEADAMVGERDHERLVEDPDLAQAAHHVTERTVCVLRLKQVALLALQRGKSLLPDPLLDPAQDRNLDPVRLGRGQIQVRHVRQQRVHHVEVRLAVVAERRGEATDVACAWEQRPGMSRAHALLVLGLAEVAPAVADLRDPVGVRRRQHEVQVDDAGIVGERAGCVLDLLCRRLALLLLADRRRAHVRQRLDPVHVIAPAEQREEALRVVRVDR